ncbi:hypothetical protein WJX64_09880 [Leifsonia sp. YIM 134122]|uniref:NADH-ubiquinone oxidoreductase n=1 Tax=Leifsonia stereocauli TaxID=3134136 RepID=A0ABU9W4D2_9MICO
MTGPPVRSRRLRREAWGFAIGSLGFLVGSLPSYAEAVGTVTTNATFFVGSIFFTLAAFVQLSLSGRKVLPRNMSRVDRYDWWAAASQFLGTLFFNLSTAEALRSALADPDQVGAGWRPDAFGSILFLISSALAIVATRGRGRLWDPDARPWHGLWLNAVGSVAFAISAVGAWVIPETGSYLSLFWANLGTLIGAVCFLVAALLSRRGAD